MKNNENVGCQRAPHDKNNPYFMTTRSAAQSKLSLEAKGLLWFMLSLPTNWVAHPTHLAKIHGIGKKIYTIINELIKTGYCVRSVKRDDCGRHISTNYMFHEIPVQVTDNKCSEPDDENRKVADNDCEQLSDLRDSANQDSAKRHAKEYIDNNKIEISKDSLKVQKENQVAAKAADNSLDVFSSEIQETGQKIIETIKIVKPDYSITGRALVALLTMIDYMIRLDGRKPEMIIRVFQWAIGDSFWCAKMFKPNPAKYLREKFDQLEMQMIAKPPKKERKFCPSSRDDIALKALENMERYRDDE